jgi:hypothetical protein
MLIMGVLGSNVPIFLKNLHLKPRFPNDVSASSKYMDVPVVKP